MSGPRLTDAPQFPTTKMQEPLEPASTEIDATDLRRACEGITRMRARLIAGRAAAQATATEATSDTGSFVNTMNSVGPIQQNLKFLAQSESVLELFAKPNSNLNPAAINLREEIVENMRKLAKIDCALSEIQEICSDNLIRKDVLMKEFEGVCKELSERIEFTGNTDAQITEENQESELAKIARKTEKMREFISRFFTYSNYDFLEDKDDLMSLLPMIREPYTVERLLSQISEYMPNEI